MPCFPVPSLRRWRPQPWLRGWLGKPLEIVDGLHEHDRSNVPFNAESFHDSVAHFFRHAAFLVLGKETADQAHARFAAAVEGILAEHVDRNIAIIAHGTVISLYVARAAGLDPMCLWERLGLPSYVVLSVPGLQVSEVVESV